MILDFEILDDYGYPTEDLLGFISDFDYRDGWENLLELVWDCWSYDYPYKHSYEEDSEVVYEFSTGGWSGNESLIGALTENLMFWSFCWYSSRRGGHYVFKVKK